MHETCIIPLGDEIRNIRLVASQSDRRITLGCVIKTDIRLRMASRAGLTHFYEHHFSPGMSTNYLKNNLRTILVPNMTTVGLGCYCPQLKINTL